MTIQDIVQEAFRTQVFTEQHDLLISQLMDQGRYTVEDMVKLSELAEAVRYGIVQVV